MEALLRLLPGPQSLLVRYGATILFVLVAFAIRYALQSYAGPYGFLIFILPVVASGLLFDRGTGFFATALSAVLVSTLIDWREDPAVDAAAIAMFVFVAGCLVFIAEGLHRALVTAHKAQRAADLLLQEMSHRVKNKFAMVSSIISLQARQSTPEVRQALEDISSRVNVIANVHNFLQLSRHEGLIQMSEYLPALSRSLQQAVGPQNISVSATAPKVELPPEKALAAGVIVNELVTNAFKYAFAGRPAGHVRVSLAKEDGVLILSVADDGLGRADGGREGLGTRLVTVFADQLGGKAEWCNCDPAGCVVQIRFPA
jgi:two-component system, sensor histidine kinase PdtaS